MRDGVRGGKPCFVGTRIAVYDVLEYLTGGMTAAGVVADFPELTTRLSDAFPGSTHVTAAGLEHATDREVWD